MSRLGSWPWISLRKDEGDLVWVENVHEPSYVLCLSFEYEFAVLKITAYQFEISGDSYDLTFLENTVNP
ncbi:unnamed protein product, partial [marine sediment metagenome]